MKTIQITKREQHLLMTVVRVVADALNGVDKVRIDPGAVRDLLYAQPGMGTQNDTPSRYELDSILERLSSNDEE